MIKISVYASEALYNWLRDQAREQHRSLSGQALVILENAMRAEKPAPDPKQTAPSTTD